MLKFYQLQIELLQNIVLCDLSPKGLLRHSRNLLGLFRKSKAVLRQDNANEHWQQIRQLTICYIEQLPSIINLHLASLSPEDEQLLIGFLELVSACSVVLYEEAELDNANMSLERELKLTQEQIEALQNV